MTLSRISEVDEMRTYDVGKRNAIVITTPGESSNLAVDIDGEPRAADGSPEELSEMLEDMREAEGAFDIIVTHPHGDHASAGERLVQEDDIEIGVVGMAGVDDANDIDAPEEYDRPVQIGEYDVESKATHRSLYHLFTESNGAVDVEAGTHIQLDDNRSVIGLWPPNEEQGIAPTKTDMNNKSTVVKYRRHDTGADVLFTGDIEEQTEHQLVELYGEELDADVLVLPHHGAQQSGSRELLDTVDPDEIVLSARAVPSRDVGESQKPDLETLERIHETNPEATIRWTGAEGRALHGIDDGVSGSSERPLREDRTNGGLTPADALAIRYAQELHHAAGSSDSKLTPDELIKEGVLTNVPWEDHAETELPRPPECLRESELVHAEMIGVAERPDESPVEDQEPRHRRPR